MSRKQARLTEVPFTNHDNVTWIKVCLIECDTDDVVFERDVPEGSRGIFAARTAAQHVIRRMRYEVVSFSR